MNTIMNVNMKTMRLPPALFLLLLVSFLPPTVFGFQETVDDGDLPSNAMPPAATRIVDEDFSSPPRMRRSSALRSQIDESNTTHAMNDHRVDGETVADRPYGPEKLSYSELCLQSRSEDDCRQRMDHQAWERANKNRKFLTKKGRLSLVEEEMERRKLQKEQHEQQPSAPLSPPLRNLQLSNQAPRFDNSGTFNILVCLVQWQDHGSRAGQVSQADYEFLFNGQGRDATLAPGGTVRDWFEAQSYGEMTINAYVADWIVATGFNEQTYTGDGSKGRTQELQDAFEPVLDTLDNMGINFGQFDSDFDRLIDLTVFLHSGYDGTGGRTDCDGTTSQQRIASHARWTADESSWFSRAGYGLGSYVVAPAFRDVCDTEIARIGTIVHEMIHPFGIPDLYDVDGPMTTGLGTLGGIDQFDTMSNPGGQSFDLALPGHLSVWTKYKLGWIVPTPITADGTYTLRPAEKFPDAFIINEGFQLQEYLLIENRQPIAGDFDEKFWAGGATVYHIDENIWTVFSDGGNEGNSPRGGPFLGAAWPGNNLHYPVALLQADGLYELEQSLNSGHAADLYRSATQSLGPGNGATFPNTDSYAFGVVKSTGITLSNFQAQGTTMSFNVGGMGGVAPPTALPITSPTNPPPTNPPPTAAPVPPPTASPVPPPTAAPQPGPTNLPQTPSPTKAPTKSPTPQPTPRPTNAPRPTPRPTQKPAPPRPSPTSAPELQNPTNAPNVPVTVPTVAPGPQQCSSATSLDISSKPVFGFFGLTTERLAQLETDGLCDTKQASVGGWYEILGNGNILTATVCLTQGSGEAMMSVFEGGCDDGLSCVEGQIQQVPSCPFGYSVSWLTETNKVYHVMVSGTADRPFAIRLKDRAIMQNQQCSNSVPYINTDVKGNTVGTTAISETCYGDELPGVWYRIPKGRVTSDGQDIVFNANTCVARTSFYNTISVFRGGCGSLECVSTDRISCQNGETGQAVYWTTTTDEEFFMFVHADESAVGSPDFSAGAYQLNLKGFLEKPNDGCSGALPIIIDGSTFITGSTRGSKPDASFDAPCGVESAGVWYKVTGTGTPGSALQVTTCLPGTTTPTNIHVFAGDCENLQCVSIEGGNTAACSEEDGTIRENSATVNFRTIAGVEYYILVGSRDGTEGNFALQLREFSPRNNDDCPNAEVIVPGQAISSSTVQGTPDFTYGETCGAPLDTSGLWYTVEGTGNGMEISTCLDNNYNSAISIFTGNSCENGERTCLTGSATRDPLCDYQGVTAAWLTEDGQKYYVFVHGSPLNSMGNFKVRARQFNVTEPNEFCQQAILVLPDGSRIQGSTEDAIHGSGIAECGIEMINPGLWYKFEGTGLPIEVSACKVDDSDNFDVSVSVFMGDNCGEASCLAGATFAGQLCLPGEVSPDRRFLQDEEQQKFVLESRSGEMHYVYVHGQNPNNSEGGGMGDYELYIRELVPPTSSPTSTSSKDDKDSSLSDGDDGAENEADVSAITSESGGKNKNNNALFSLLLLLLVIPLLWYYRKCVFACFLRRKERSRNSDTVTKETNDDDWDPSAPPSQKNLVEGGSFRSRGDGGERNGDRSGNDEDGNDQSSSRSMISDGYDDEDVDGETNVAQGDSDDEEYDESRGRRFY